MSIPLPCPDGELLAAIMRGHISSESETQAIGRHLAECAQCRAVANLLLDFDEPVVPGFTSEDSTDEASDEPACPPEE